MYRTETDVTVLTGLGGAGGDPLGALIGRGARFDTIVSIFQLAAVHDFARRACQLAALLDPAGNLLFLEPTRQPGPMSGLQRLASPGLTLAAGFRVDRDIPDLLRRHGFRVVTLERLRQRSVLPHLRPMVRGRAEHR